MSFTFQLKSSKNRYPHNSSEAFASAYLLNLQFCNLNTFIDHSNAITKNINKLIILTYT